MLSQNLTDFYNNWTAKADAIIDNNLSSIYDKYITLFITFNNLYNQIPSTLISRGDAVPNRIYDNQAATEYVIKLIGAQSILDNLTNQNNNADVNAIIDVIDQQLFYIKLNFGQRQRNEDLKILTNLRSTNANLKARAILQVIYYVRCNMFHGHKDFVEYQKLLVEPLARILKTVNQQLFNELSI